MALYSDFHNRSGDGLSSFSYVYQFFSWSAGNKRSIWSCSWGGHWKCRYTACSTIYDTAFLCGASAGFTGFFRHVLEFMQAGVPDSCRADTDRDAGGMGVCKVSVPWKENTVFSLYAIDDYAVSSDHGF